MNFKGKYWSPEGLIDKYPSCIILPFYGIIINLMFAIQCDRTATIQQFYSFYSAIGQQEYLLPRLCFYGITKSIATIFSLMNFSILIIIQKTWFVVVSSFATAATEEISFFHFLLLCSDTNFIASLTTVTLVNKSSFIE